MPSIKVMPVACFHSARVTAGNASPADTHLRNDEPRSASACAAITR